MKTYNTFARADSITGANVAPSIPPSGMEPPLRALEWASSLLSVFTCLWFFGYYRLHVTDHDFFFHWASRRLLHPAKRDRASPSRSLCELDNPIISITLPSSFYYRVSRRDFTSPPQVSKASPISLECQVPIVSRWVFSGLPISLKNRLVDS